jgi:Zn-dependent protease with chaperone function
MAVETVTTQRRRAIGRARFLVQLPSVVAGAGVLAEAAGPYSVWALAVWVLGGLASASRTGERLTLRFRGFRPLNPLQRLQLQPVAAAALVQARLGRDDVDWYVLPGRDPNAFAAGRRAVAVSTGLLGELASGRLSEPMVRAIVVHDLLSAPVTAMPEMPAA